MEMIFYAQVEWAANKSCPRHSLGHYLEWLSP